MTNQHITSLNAQDMLHLFISGTKFLEHNVDAINSLNVFPVPDGDTGINMLLTLKTATDSAANSISDTKVSTVMEALAKGALLGARGNRGVIFSQFVKGMATGLHGCAECDSNNLKKALVNAAETGYLAVGKPVEGTMLTVMRAAADGALSSDDNLINVLSNAYESAVRSLESTPEQLPILKEAGVVDAGGQGLVAFLAGALGFIRSEEVEFKISVPLGSNFDSHVSINSSFAEHAEEEMYGYCTQFVILGSQLNSSKIRADVMTVADSTVVIGDEQLIRIHAHTYNPGELLNLGTRLGNLDQISIQNMDIQREEFFAKQDANPTPLTERSIISIAAGKGISSVLKNLGSSLVIEGCQAMNPSTQEILNAIDQANALFTIILPNNRNVTLAAQQALELSSRNGVIIPTKTIPEGISALLSASDDQSQESLVESMTHAISEIKSGEVTTAARSTTFKGMDISEGDIIAIIDDELVAARKSEEEALIAMLQCALTEDDSLVTLYFGGSTDSKSATSTTAVLSKAFPAIEFEVIEGNQPYYQYLVSIE